MRTAFWEKWVGQEAKGRPWRPWLGVLAWAVAVLPAVAQSTPRLSLLLENGELVARCEVPAGKIGVLLRTSGLQSSSWELQAAVCSQLLVERVRLASAGSVTFYRLATAPRPDTAAMAWIPPGEFVMGSSDSELDRQADEGPARLVRIPVGFWMARWEVTRKAYAALMGLGPVESGMDQRPVTEVSWEEARQYCEVLNQKHASTLPVGYAYRLPTEAEWEYAARAGTTTRYSFGDDRYAVEINDYGWWRGNASMAMDVGQKRPNPWGLYDIHGNVFEWCMDVYQAYPGGIAPGAEPRHHISRGGSNYCPARYLRSASRHHYPMERNSLVGFRVVLAPRMPWPSLVGSLRS